MMLWFGIGSLFMTFAGLTSAFIVSKNREDWVQNFDLPEAFYYSLIFILSSSIILIFARRLLIKNQQKKVSVLLLITILLGTLFIVFQFLGFGQIMADGYHFTGPTSTINSSFIFLIAFVHLVHVLVALIALIVVFVKNLKGVYNCGFQFHVHHYASFLQHLNFCGLLNLYQLQKLRFLYCTYLIFP